MKFSTLIAAILCAALLGGCAEQQEFQPAALKSCPETELSLTEASRAKSAEEPSSGLQDVYAKVLADLWDKDPALREKISYIGFDLSSTSLTGEEKAALMEEFAGSRKLEPLEGTFEELTEAGYIDEENLYWEDGCLLTITEKESDEQGVTFDAQIWRSGLGAYFFMDCTTDRKGLDYTRGAEAIS